MSVEMIGDLQGWIKENGPGGWIDDLRVENKSVKLERDSLITALRECVVALDRCRKRLSIWDTQELELFAKIERANQLLERYK